MVGINPGNSGTQRDPVHAPVGVKTTDLGPKLGKNVAVGTRFALGRRKRDSG